MKENAPSIEVLKNEYNNFTQLHSDNWNDLIHIGVPLYRRLIESGLVEEASDVHGTLEYTSSVIQNSGAVTEEEKNLLRQSISEGLA